MRGKLRKLVTIPTREERIRARAGAPLNPITIVRMLSPLQVAFFCNGWLAWTCDACDFFAVSLSAVRLSSLFGFGHNNHKITTAITLTVLLRPVGALIFGPLADRYGRKWPLIANLVLIAVFSFVTSRVHTFQQFLAVRSLFGISMGGIYGVSCSLALENAPAATQGFLSGLMQSGYALGYIFCAIVNIAFVNRSGNWRILYIFGGVLSMLCALLRLVLPESPHFVKLKASRETRKRDADQLKRLKVEMKWLAKNCWGRFLFGVLVVIGLSFLAHASQDAYPIILQKAKGLSPDQASRATIIGLSGSVIGSVVAGYISQYIGRRLAMAIYSIVAGLLIPAWILPNTWAGLAAGSFALQFTVQGISGILPALLQTLSPAQYRSTFPGMVQQIGVMITACSAQIETSIGDRIQIRNPKYTPGSTTEPPTIPDLARVSAVFLALTCIYLLLVCILGPDYDASPRLGENELDRKDDPSAGPIAGDPIERADSVADKYEMSRGKSSPEGVALSTMECGDGPTGPPPLKT